MTITNCATTSAIIKEFNHIEHGVLYDLQNKLSNITYENELFKLIVLPPIYANNAAALAGGLTVGTVYRTGGDPDVIAIVH